MGTELKSSRRTFLQGTAACLAAIAMPRLALARSGDNHFDLRATKTPFKLGGNNNPASDLWLYNGSSPGPEIRVVQGDTVRVRFTNELDEPTSIHWHGIRIANAMDGVSGLTQEAVKPGETFEYVFEVPDAGTFWYHAHNKSWEQVARGLYGPLIVDEAVAPFDRAHDLTLIIDDWRLDENGAFDVASLGFLGDWSHAGRLGGWMTVNGQSQPTFTLEVNQTYRLRLINAANARILWIDPNVIGAKIAAYDGFAFPDARKSEGPYEPLLPAQRMDLLVTPKQEALTRLDDVGEFALTALSGREPLRIAKFNIVDAGRMSASPEVSSLPMNTVSKPDLTNARQIELLMEGGAMGRMGRMMHKGRPMRSGDFERTGQFWSFNGVANLAEKPLFRAKAGETIVLTTDNQTGWPHGIHLHGHHFQVLEYNGEAMENTDWRDTFAIDGNDRVKIAFVAENPGKWMLHCHMLEHAAAGMRTWFEVD